MNHASGQASVTATIIDLDEMDRKILGVAPQELARAKGWPERSATVGQPARPGRSGDPVEEGKALVRYARQQYRAGKESESMVAYQMAIEVLDGRLRELAILEFRRVFGAAADQSLRMARIAR